MTVQPYTIAEIQMLSLCHRSFDTASVTDQAELYTKVNVKRYVKRDASITRTLGEPL
jgi:hypothetical protein